MNRLPVILTGVLAMVASLFLIVFQPPFMSSVSRQAFDIMVRASARPPQADAVVMVNIDDDSLAEIGPWPWPRHILANLTDRLWKQGAAVVAFDILFPEEDRTSPLVAEREWRKAFGTDVNVEGIPSGKSDFDRVFAEALSQGRSILGCHMDVTSLPQSTVPADDLYRSHYFESGFSQRDHLPQASGHVSSLAILRRAAAAEAFFNTMPHSDNVIRRTPLIIACGADRIYPSMSLEAIRLLSDESTFRITYADEAGRGVRDVRMHELVVPTDANGMLLLNFRSAPFPSVSAREILSGPIRPDRFLNRIVFVSTSAAGLRDLKATPMSTEMPGIAVHATAVDNMLAGDMLREPREALHAILFAAAVTGIILIILVSRGHAWIALFAALACVAAAWTASWWCLKEWRFVVVPSGIAMLATLVYTTMIVAKFWLAGRDRRRIDAW
jgi:adenylate cyclase